MPEKTEALLVTDRRSSKYPRIVLGEHKIEWKKSIKYLGVQLDRRLSFGEHIQIATAKAIQCGATLTRLMPNIGGRREAKRRLVVSVVNSKLLYAALVWTNALNNHAIQKKLFSAQRGVVLRIVSAYRTVLTSAALVLVSVPPIDLSAEERKETFQLRKDLTCATNLQEITRTKEAICKDVRRRLLEKWQTRWRGDQSARWTHRLIPELATWLDRKHGQVGFYQAHALSGHGCFNAYLKRFKKRDDELFASTGGGGFSYSSPGWRGLSACLTGVCPRMGFPGEGMTEESYATLSWNQLPAKFKAERRFRRRCIGSIEGVFWF